MLLQLLLLRMIELKSADNALYVVLTHVYIYILYI